MNRRKFIKLSALGAGALAVVPQVYAKSPRLIKIVGSPRWNIEIGDTQWLFVDDENIGLCELTDRKPYEDSIGMRDMERHLYTFTPTEDYHER